MQLPLKGYQRETLEQLGAYCDAIRRAQLTLDRQPEAAAYFEQTERPYFTPPGFDGVPYICLRLPTGGGKTLLAAHAVGTIARHLLGHDAPVCLWICPSTTIRDQTLRVLRDKRHDHHYLALRDALGPDVTVVTLEEALQQANLVAGRAPLVIVTTIQSYRVKDERSGEEVESNRRIYRDNGYLQRAFEDLPEILRRQLGKDERGLVNLSLANALMLRAPIVIMDEAHNARTPTSFDSLARFGPSCVVELTATPQQEHAPDRDLYASNVLHPVSALQLKNEGMIKLPIDLESRGDWLEVLAATKQRLDELDRKADEFADSGGFWIRPLALIQAQPKRTNQETHHAEAVKQALIEQLGIPANEVRICTGTTDEIGGEDLMSQDCRVRYIITVDKLREGWDCPFAYVLGSIGNAATATAVEQLLGRIIRQPFASPTRVPALDRAYAFVLSNNVARTAIELRDRLVQSCGFDISEATDALRVRNDAVQRGIPFGRLDLTRPLGSEGLPASLRARVTVEEGTNTLRIAGEITHEEAIALRNAVAEQDRELVNDFWEEMRPLGVGVRELEENAPSIFVPRLTMRLGDRRTLLEPQELDEFAWNLNACDATLSVAEFPDSVQVGTAATIDLQGEAIVTASVREVRLIQLELIGEGEDWTNAELANWLDNELHRDDAFRGLPKKESQPWFHRVVQALVGERRLPLANLVRRRHQLAQLTRTIVADHGRGQVREAMSRLIHERPEAIETSATVVFEMSDANYAPYPPYERHYFPKHAFDRIASMNRPEFDCAEKIDSHPRVKRWVRNLDRETQGGFSLPKSPGNFFPDFIVELIDGTIVAVEYKNSSLDEKKEEQHKKAVGELWAMRSGGKCRFAWVVDGNWAELDRVLGP